MSRPLVEMFRHNLWANQQLLELCAGLDDDLLAATAPGTYGRVHDTLVHMVRSEEGYLFALTGERGVPLQNKVDGLPKIEELRERSRRSGERLIEYAERDGGEGTLSGIYQGSPYEMPAAIPLLQAINHATEHRTHIATILTQQDVEPPTLDGWQYGEDMLGAS